MNRSRGANLAATLRDLRASRGLTLRELAGPSDVSASYLHLLETGGLRNPSISVVLRLARALDVPVEVLVEAARQSLDSRPGD